MIAHQRGSYLRCTSTETPLWVEVHLVTRVSGKPKRSSHPLFTN